MRAKWDGDIKMDEKHSFYFNGVKIRINMK